jgi:hypothetical protein
VKTPAQRAQTTEQAQADIEWLLRLALDMGGPDDEDDEEHMNDIAKRWGIER